jgi:type IX secretion system PorP/SprF family membrane protein
VLPHFYAIGGVVFDLSNSVQFKPAVLVKAVSGAPIAADLSANFLFNDKLTLGAAYRWDAAASLLAGFQITDNLLIGYAYDKDTSSLGRYNNGSHEVFIKFNFNRNCANCVIRNTRFF